MTDFDHVKDSGTRQEFDTGAVRDAQSGKGRYDLLLTLPHMLYRLARHFENGAKKYGDDNWRKGLPLRRFIDSAFRHLCQYMEGKDDEDHLTAVIWNLMCHGETANMIAAGWLPTDLDDMPPGVGGAKPTPETPLDNDPNYQPQYADEDGPVPVGGLVHELRQDNCLLCGKYHGGACSDDPTATAWAPLHERANGITTATAPTWYIAGPMRGIPYGNFPAFDKAAKIARDNGLSVISPAEMDRAEGFDPVMDELTPEILRRIIQRDTNAIQTLNPERGDGLLLLPGWARSVGCQAEVPLALWLGLKFKEIFPDAAEYELFLCEISPEEIRERLFHREPDGRGMC